MELTYSAEQAVLHAQGTAPDKSQITAEQLFASLLVTPDTVAATAVRKAAGVHMKSLLHHKFRRPCTQDLRYVEIINAAESWACRLEHACIGSEHLLLAVIEFPGRHLDCLQERGCALDTLRQRVFHLLGLQADLSKPDAARALRKAAAFDALTAGGYLRPVLELLHNQRIDNEIARDVLDKIQAATV